MYKSLDVPNIRASSGLRSARCPLSAAAAWQLQPLRRAPKVGDETPASNGRSAASVPLVLSRGGRRGDALGPSGSLRWGQSIL